MLKITIIANGFQKDYVVNLINGLLKSRCKIEFIGSSFYEISKLDPSGGITEIKDERNYNSSLIRKFGNNLRYYGRLFSHFIKQKSDIIHIQWLNLIIPDGIMLPLFLKALGMNTLYTVHDVLPHSKDHFINRMLFWFVYRCQGHLLVHTRFIKMRLIEEFGIRPEKIDIIKHGVYDIPDNPSVDRQQARDLLSLGKQDLVILLFGIITRYKGLHILLEAFTRLSPNDDSAKLIIAGKVAKDYRSEFDKLMENYESDRIQVFSNHITEERMDVLFKATDVTVLPYIEASQSGVLFMSYAYGKPVIAPRLGGFPDDIVEGRTGYLFEAGKPESLADTLKKFQVDYTNNSRFGNDDIKTYARENYSWDKTGETLLGIYSELTDQQPK